MTLQQLQRIVQILSNQGFVRYWVHYNYPATPPLMAIAVMDHRNINALHQQLLDKGFQRVENSHFPLWTIERTDVEPEVAA